MPVKRISYLLKRITYPAFKKMREIALRGKNVECPCCGSKYITFLPAGINKRANASCLKCGSLERHRNLWLFFSANPQLFTKPMKLLHAAPEKIFYKKYASEKDIDYHAVDLHPEGYGVKIKRMDLTDLKYENNFFDAIICSHVLEHVPKDIVAMKEMYRVLKPGGWAVLNVPVNQQMEHTFEEPDINDPKKQLELFGQTDHVRIYGRDYVERLKCAGFEVDIIQYPLQLSPATRFYYGLKENELIYLCRK